ncbi:MAG TPA: hypothetical protein VM638_02745, partial [Actinomycetota bacterium]|nr:hypothetical protein [Actinomycetota bacterium]
MALVDERVARAPSPQAPVARRREWLPTLLVVAAALGAAWVWLGPFILHPERLPPGPDMAWYQWRAELLTAHPPATMVLADGPLHVFGGGYRIVSPVLGALVQQLTGVDEYSVSYALIAGRQVLLGLALGALAYRLRRDAWVFVATVATVTAVLHLRPFVGYVDNVIALTFATGALWF